MATMKELRIQAGLTQIQLAEKIGASQASVSQWESGNMFPRRTIWPRLAEALECSIDELITAYSQPVAKGGAAHSDEA